MGLKLKQHGRDIVLLNVKPNDTEILKGINYQKGGFVNSVAASFILPLKQVQTNNTAQLNVLKKVQENHGLIFGANKKTPNKKENLIIKNQEEKLVPMEI